MKGDTCKVCSEPVDIPKSSLCRKCYYVYRKALPSHQKYLQEKAWKNTLSYQKKLQEKAWKNWPSYKKNLQEKAWQTYPKTCEACGAAYEAYGKTSRLCPICYARQQELKTASTTRGQYKQLKIDGRVIKEHRYLAEQVFGRKLTPDEHIHHLDEDPKHNELSNLLVLFRNNHFRLHHYLDVQQVIEGRKSHPKPWSELVVPLSLQWLHENKIPYILLSELKTFKDWLIQLPEINNRSGYLDYLVDGYCRLYLYPDLYRVTKWVAGYPPLSELA